MDAPKSENNPLMDLYNKYPTYHNAKSYSIYQNIYKRIHLRSCTPLQELTFNTPEFWDTNKSLLIRGATSSGKTLIAEVAMAQCRCSTNKPKTIYLAPLRAMVSEKYKNFKDDFVSGVYASSRDYQSNDSRITDNQYEIAVIVYEKFYALISQNDPSSFLESCGLIVLDEIQMLGDTDRGMKIIMSLIKALDSYPNIRIIGLCTTHCDTEEIQTWFEKDLKKELFVIENERNSLPLEEMVVHYNGKFRGKYIPSSKDVADEGWKEKELEKAQVLKTDIDDMDDLDSLPEMDLGPLESAKRSDDQKRNLLLRIIKISKDRKVIIFCHSRNYCRSLAAMIAQYTESSKPLPDELGERLAREDNTDIKRELAETLLPKGVAYHHSALSHSMRAIIEDAFTDTRLTHDRARLNVLVATETLAIGVNLPADIIIVYDTMKYNSEGDRVPIDEQTYKNYIGRAGRLMDADSERTNPRSYLMAMTDDDFRKYWYNYVLASKTKIIPVFKMLREERAIPYFLSLLAGRRLSIDEIRDTLNQKLPGVNGVNKLIEMLETKPETINRNSDKNDWVHADLTIGKVPEDDMDLPIVYYRLKHFGKQIVPYALNVRTSALIHYYFILCSKGGLPADATANDIEKDRYLLDILFHICKMPEISQKFRQFTVSFEQGNTDRYYKLRDGLLHCFRESYTRTQQIWQNSILVKTIDPKKNNEDDCEMLSALLKVAILFEWASGNLLSDFKAHTGIPFSPEEGDVERLADMASFLLEAIASSIITSELSERRRMKSSLMKLSSRVKYGCDDECVRILNCHISGISRQAILEARRDLKNANCGQTLYRFFMYDAGAENYLTSDQLNELRKELQQKYKTDETSIVANLSGEGLISEPLKELFSTRSRNTDWYLSFLEAASNNEYAPFLLGPAIELPTGQGTIRAVAQMCYHLHIVFPKCSMNGFNPKSFHQIFETRLKQFPGKYVFVHSEIPSINWDVLQQWYPGTTITWMQFKEFSQLYLMQISETNGEMNPFIYTLYKSPGGVFDCNSGVPAPQPENDDQTPDVFISYKHSSSMKEAEALYTKIYEETGMRPFIDTIGLRPGDYLPDTIRAAIEKCTAYVLLFDDLFGSDRAPWTKYEINEIVRLLRKEGIASRKVFPVILTDTGMDTFKKTDEPLSKLKWSDFRNGKRAASKTELIQEIKKLCTEGPT